MRNRIRACAAFAFVTALGLSCGGGETEKQIYSDRPTAVLLIDIETMRPDHLGAYGYGRPTSPNIDAFAKSAFQFDWAFSQAPMTGPSQATILTGLYPSSHGMVDEGSKLSDEANTLAEILRLRGFKTAAFVDGGYLSEGFGLEQGFDEYDNSHGEGFASIGPKVKAWLTENGNTNFFLLVHSYDAHTPYNPPEPHRTALLDGVEKPASGFEPTAEAMEGIRVAALGADPTPLDPVELEYAKSLYDGEIRFVDEWVGKIVAQIDQLGLAPRTLVVLLSDHGEEFQEHGSVLHEKLYSTVTHVPLLVRLPGGDAARRIPHVVELADVMPTILDVVGAEIPAYVQGESLVPIIRDLGQPPYLAFSETPFFDGWRAVAMGGYHMLVGGDPERTELYYLAEDPTEQKNIAADEPDRAAVLSRYLAGWVEKVEGFTYAGGEAANVGEETLDQLKSLGYVQ